MAAELHRDVVAALCRPFEVDQLTHADDVLVNFADWPRRLAAA